MIGKDRSLKLGKNNDGLIMRDKGSKKTAVGIFPTMSGRNRQPAIQIVAGRGRGLLQPLRWRMARIVDKRFYCIDLRKWWLPIGETSCKPTKTGIALRLSEWPTFKEAIDKLHRDYPNVCNFTPCFLFQDHTSQQSIAACRECNPFPSTIA